MGDSGDSSLPPSSAVEDAPGGQPRGDSSGASSTGSVAPASGDDRRTYDRFDVVWSVDCETEDTFLYASIANISEMGIFVKTTEPLPIGTGMTLRFAPPDSTEPFVLSGVVQWVNDVRPLSDNPNPGMGIRFTDLTLDNRERIVEAIRTIAYLREEPRNNKPN